MALADVFDALVSKRCYKESYSYDRAFGIIGESLGSHFDPELGACFMELRPKLEKLYDTFAAQDDAAKEAALTESVSCHVPHACAGDLHRDELKLGAFHE